MLILRQIECNLLVFGQGLRRDRGEVRVLAPERLRDQIIFRVVEGCFAEAHATGQLGSMAWSDSCAKVCP